jgi:hypothetical protein
VALGEDSPRVQILHASGAVLGRAQLSTWPAPRMQTRLDLGIAAARDEIAANGRSHVERAIVVLTDGLANPVPMDVAVAEADAARALGITIHAVGLGHAIDEPGLRRIAGHPSRYHHATDDDDLAELYGRIASRLPCPGRWFWGKRP